MAGQTKTIKADLAAQSADNSANRERLRHTLRTLAKSRFEKGIPSAARDLADEAESIAREIRYLDMREPVGKEEMKKKMGTAIGMAYTRLAGQLSESHAEGVIEAARAMQVHDFDGATAAMHRWSFSSEEHEIATLLAAVTLMPPAPEDRDEASCSRYLEDVRNIIRTYSHQLWDFYPNIRERIIEHAKGILRN